MGLLSAVFGSTGQGLSLFGVWFWIGLFLLLFFVLVLFGARVSFEGILWFLLLFILLVIEESLFDFPPELIITGAFFVFLIVSFYLYKIFNK